MDDNDSLAHYADMGLLLKYVGPPVQPAGNLTFIAGGEVDEASVTLRFFGSDLDPDDISHRLGCTPTTSRRKGEIVRERWIATTGVWFLRQPRRPEHLAAQIQELFDRLPTGPMVWDHLRRFDGQLFCRLSCRTWNRQLDLPPELSKQLALRHLTLTLDLYFEPDEHETSPE